MSVFYRNWSYRLKCRERKENFRTITVIIFLNLTMFQYRPDWPQEWSILKEFRVVNYRIVTNSNYFYAIQRWISFGKPLWVICCSKEINCWFFLCENFSCETKTERGVFRCLTSFKAFSYFHKALHVWFSTEFRMHL